MNNKEIQKIVKEALDTPIPWSLLSNILPIPKNETVHIEGSSVNFDGEELPEGSSHFTIGDVFVRLMYCRYDDSHACGKRDPEWGIFNVRVPTGLSKKETAKIGIQMAKQMMRMYESGEVTLEGGSLEVAKISLMKVKLDRDSDGEYPFFASVFSAYSKKEKEWTISRVEYQMKAQEMEVINITPGVKISPKRTLWGHNMMFICQNSIKPGDFRFGQDLYKMAFRTSGPNLEVTTVNNWLSKERIKIIKRKMRIFERVVKKPIVKILIVNVENNRKEDISTITAVTPFWKGNDKTKNEVWEDYKPNSIYDELGAW